jgi:hypothetical protein
MAAFASAALLATPCESIALSGEELKLIKEAVELRLELESTKWAWETRDVRESLEDRLIYLKRVLKSLNEWKLSQGVSEVADAEVMIFAEIEEVRRRIHDTTWTWQNRDERTRLEARISYLEAEIKRMAMDRD